MAKKTEKVAEEKVKIKLPRLRDGKNQAAFVGVNGKTFLIQRGVEVEVPKYVAVAIENNRRMRDEADDYLNSIISK